MYAAALSLIPEFAEVLYTSAHTPPRAQHESVHKPDSKLYCNSESLKSARVLDVLCFVNRDAILHRNPRTSMTNAIGQNLG